MKSWSGETIGRMRDVVEIQQKDVNAKDDVGERITVWNSLGEHFALMDFRRRGSEKFEQILQVSPQTTIECTIYRETVPGINTSDYRILFNSETYTIDSVLPVEGNNLILLELKAAEVD